MNGSAAQYLDLRQIAQLLGFENPEAYPSVHCNLCGVLAAMQSVGVSLEEGLRRFNELFPGVLQQGGTTDSGQLETFFREAFDWFAVPCPFNHTNSTVLALVTIQGGQLNPQGGVPHWVRVTRVSNDRVWSYNPYGNAEECADWVTFREAWADTPTNENVRYRLVVASR